MKFKPNLHLKWIDPAGLASLGDCFEIFNECVLAATDATGDVAGFSVFQPRDLNDGLIERFTKRMARPEHRLHKLHLYAPPFIQHRVQTLAAKHNFGSIQTQYTSFLKIECLGHVIKLRSRMRVVNVDDSPVLLKFLKQNLTDSGYIDVVGQASDPTQAVALIQNLKPDAVTMDIQMPRMTGVDVVKAILAKEYYPIIMISSLGLDEGTLVFDALNAGAFDYIQKPKLEDRDQFKKDLFEKLLLAIEGRNAHSSLQKKSTSASPKSKSFTQQSYASNLIWCLGSSTGGTQALTRVFTSLPNQIPPTFIVQHIPPVFSKAFADSLDQLCPYDVCEATDGLVAEPNHVYIAPGGFQMAVEQQAGRLVIRIRDDAPVNRFKPSVDYLFKTVAKLSGQQVVAGVLTGMGRDGAEGLLALKNAGAKTFAQDENTSTVYGMPRAAHEIGATDLLVPIDSVANALLDQSQAFKKSA